MATTRFTLIALVVGIVFIFVASLLIISARQFTAEEDGSGDDSTAVITPLFDELKRQGISYEEQLQLIDDLQRYGLELEQREELHRSLNDYLNLLSNSPEYNAAANSGNDEEMQRVARSLMSDALKELFLPVTDRIQTILVGYLLGQKQGEARPKWPNLTAVALALRPSLCYDQSKGKPLPKPFDDWLRCPPALDSPFLGGGQLIGPGNLTIDYGKAPGNGAGAIIRRPDRDVGVGLKIGKGNDIIPIIGGGSGSTGGYIGHRSDCTWFAGIIGRR